MAVEASQRAWGHGRRKSKPEHVTPRRATARGAYSRAAERGSPERDRASDLSRRGREPVDPSDAPPPARTRIAQPSMRSRRLRTHLRVCVGDTDRRRRRPPRVRHHRRAERRRPPRPRRPPGSGRLTELRHLTSTSSSGCPPRSATRSDRRRDLRLHGAVVVGGARPALARSRPESRDAGRHGAARPGRRAGPVQDPASAAVVPVLPALADELCARRFPRYRRLERNGGFLLAPDRRPQGARSAVRWHLSRTEQR
jgi:hypothetical protein